MSSPASPEFLEQVEREAVEYTRWRLEGLSEGMLGDDGQTYGQLPLKGADYIAWYNDLREREVQLPGDPQLDENGEPMLDEQDLPILLPGPVVTIHVLEMLRGINPKMAERFDRQAEREQQKIDVTAEKRAPQRRDPRDDLGEMGIAAGEFASRGVS